MSLDNPTLFAQWKLLSDCKTVGLPRVPPPVSRLLRNSYKGTPDWMADQLQELMTLRVKGWM